MISAIREFDEDRHESVNMRVGIHTGTGFDVLIRFSSPSVTAGQNKLERLSMASFFVVLIRPVSGV
jgi:hypothetical protein